MHDTVNAYYNSRISALDTELKKIRMILSYLYLFRLVTFLSFVAFLVLFIRSENHFLFPVLSLASLVAFLLAVTMDLKFAFKERFTSNKLLLNTNELKSLDHQYTDRETGSDYLHLNPHLATDFDLFGNASLFQYLNRCSTMGGKLKLAEGLCQSRQQEKLIREKQKAVQELVDKNKFVQDFQSHGMFLSENGNELENLKAWLGLPEEKSRILPVLCILIPLLNTCWLMMVILGIFTFNSFLLPILISLFIVGSNLKKINRAHAMLTRSAKTLKSYTTLIRLMEAVEFKSDFLSGLQNKLLHKELKAGDSLTSLFKLLNSFDLRLNILVSVLLNTFLLYDIQIWLRLGKWKEKHREIVQTWFDALSELDALTGLAIYAFNNRDDVTYPIITEEVFTCQAQEMGHPLLHPESRICNTFIFTGTPSVMIITGANMAGKSTFLRTLSVNLILAMNGAPVCAKNFIFSPCDILSSIKIQDSLSNNESYFYAELVRIRKIIDHVQTNPRTLVVLDEILRGTNSKDKQTGSLGLLEKLISHKAVVLIATHDLTLGELEKKYPEIVVNKCFEVELSNDQLVFDYKLKNGISQKLNASYLMNKMGIID